MLRRDAQFRIAGALAWAVLACGCASGHANVEAPAAIPRLSSTASSTSTSLPPSARPFSFDASVRAPQITNTGANFSKIALSLIRYGSWLDAHQPDIQRIALIAAPGSAIARAYRNDLSILARNNRRFYEVESGAPTATVVSRSQAAVSVRIRQQLRRQIVVDGAGAVRSQRTVARATTDYVAVLIELDRHWYLSSVDEVTQ